MADERYKRGKIYVIRSHITPLIYIGSTIEKSLKNRLSGHRTKFKQHKKDNAGFCASFDILEIDENCYIELYEEYPCDNKQQLEKREGQVIRELDCCNKNIAGRTDKEYREENREQIRARGRQYYAENKQKCNEKDRRYRQNNKEKINEKHNCECGGKYTSANKSLHMKTKTHTEYMEFMYY